jgi:hypothetical protein
VKEAGRLAVSVFVDVSVVRGIFLEERERRGEREGESEREGRMRNES